MLLLAVSSIYLPPVQRAIKYQIGLQVQKQFNAQLSMESFGLSFPFNLKLNKVVLRQNRDTIVDAESIKITLKLSDLWQKKINLSQIRIHLAEVSIDRLMLLIDAPESSRTPNQSTKSDWVFGLEHISIFNSHAALIDSTIGISLDIQIKLGHIKDFTYRNDTLFSAYSEIENANVNLTFFEAQPDLNPDTSAVDFKMKLSEVLLKNSTFSFDDPIGGLHFVTGAQELWAINLSLDVINSMVYIEKTAADSSYFALSLKELWPVDTVSSLPNSWKVVIPEFSLNRSWANIELFADANMHTDAYDNRFGFFDLNAKGQNFYYDAHKIDGLLSESSLNYQNKLAIKQLSGHMLWTDSLLRFDSLKLLTALNHIELDAQIPLIDHNLGADSIWLKCSVFSKQAKEFNVFLPQQWQTDSKIQKWLSYQTSLNANFSGHRDGLRIEMLNIQMPSLFYSKLNGTIQNPLDWDQLKYQLSGQILVNNPAELAHLTDIQKRSNLFEEGVLEWNSKGNLKQISIDGNYHSNVGELTFESDVKEQKGQWLITANASSPKSLVQFDGQNFEGNNWAVNVQNEYTSGGTTNWSAKFKWDKLDLDSVIFKKMTGQLSYDGQHYQLNLDDVQDNYFSFRTSGLINNDSLYNATNIDIRHFVINRLDADSEQIELSFELSTQSAYNFKSEYLDNQTQIKELQIRNGSDTQNISRIDIKAQSNSRQVVLDFNDGNNQIQFKSDTNWLAIIDFIDQFPKRLKGIGMFDTKNWLPHQLSININQPDYITQFFDNNIPKFDSLSIRSSYEPSSEQIGFKLNNPLLKIGDEQINDIDIQFEKNEHQALNGYIKGQYGDSTQNKIDLSINTSLNDSILDFGIDILLNKDMQLLYLKSDTYKDAEGSYHFHLDPEKLVLLTKIFTVDSNNLLSVLEDDIKAQNMRLKSGIQEIEIDTLSGSFVTMEFKHFNIDALSNLLPKDSVRFGELNGLFHIGLEQTFGRFDLGELVWNSKEIGHLKAQKINYHNGLLTFDIELLKNEPLLRLNGQFDSEKLSVDAHAKWNDFDLIMLDGFTKTIADITGGTSEGDLHINGPIYNPKVDGYLQFLNTNLQVEANGGMYRICPNRINISNSSLKLNHFYILDASNDSLWIDGQIDWNHEPIFKSVQVKSKQFKTFDRDNAKKQIIFGHAIMGIDLNIDGPWSRLKVKNQLKLKTPSNLTYVFPEDLSVENNDHIVKFTPIDTSGVKKDTVVSKENSWIDQFEYMSHQIVVDPGNRFKLYFDAGGKDFLDVIVDGTLKYQYDGVQTNTSGRLDIRSGLLNYSLPMVEMEKMNIESGSYITLTNDLVNPILNLKASSKIWASTGTLIPDHNKNLEFTVQIYLTGKLDNLLMQFDISNKTTDPVVSAKLSQMTAKERSINAINLLIRGEFAVQQNTSGIDFSSYVNQMMANGLNALISDRIKFVDMNFDIKTFNNRTAQGMETQSNLFFNVSKSFYHDKLSINYHNEVSVNTTTESSQSSEHRINNFEAVYNISENGNFKAVLFRKELYEGLTEEHTISTGGGIRIRRNYNTFSDMWRFRND